MTSGRWYLPNGTYWEGNFANNKSLQDIYNSLSETEKKEFRTFTTKKAREKYPNANGVMNGVMT